MSGHTCTAMLTRTSHAAKREDLTFCPSLDPTRRLRSCAFTPVASVQALRVAGQRTMRRLSRAWSTHSLLLQPDDAAERRATGPLVCAMHRHPCIDALQTKCFHRAPSLPDFPCSPSVTRSVLIPRPAARRGSASAAPPSGFGFQKIFVQLRTERGQKIFRTFRKSTRLALGAGHTRVASRKSVPRAIRANTNRRNYNGTLRKQSHAERLSWARTPRTSPPAARRPSRSCRSPPSPATRTSRRTSG